MGDIGGKKFLLIFCPVNVKFCLCTCVREGCLTCWKPRYPFPLPQHIHLRNLEVQTWELPLPFFFSPGQWWYLQEYPKESDYARKCWDFGIIFPSDKTIMPKLTQSPPRLPKIQLKGGPCLFHTWTEAQWCLGTTSPSSLQSWVPRTGNPNMDGLAIRASNTHSWLHRLFLDCPIWRILTKHVST